MKFRTVGSFTFLVSELLEQFSEITHVFTTRKGGSSAPPFDEANLSMSVGDLPSAVQKNREQICQLLDLDATKLFIPHQVLGNEVGVFPHQLKKEMDGVVTSVPNQPLLTQSADCLLLLLYDPRKRVVGNIHASWRGTLGEIAKRAVSTMQAAYDCQPSDLRGALSPAIGPCCYEVQSDVVELFRKQLPYAESCFTTRSGRTYLDLWKLNLHQLLESGVAEKNIDLARLCTKCHPELFYSYRREGVKAGRFGAIIALRG